MIGFQHFDVGFSESAEQAPLTFIASSLAACASRLGFVAFASPATAVETPCSCAFLSLHRLYALGILLRQRL
jgi:hypothetical protein